MKRMTVIGTLILCIVMTGFPNENSYFSAPGSCTIFTASFGDTVLFGNNEDYTNPKTYYWISPSTSQFLGGVYLGYDNLSPQGGINEKGLAFDYNALPRAGLNTHPELPSLYGNPGFIIIRECSTVEEAIDMAKSYSWGTSLTYQMHMADATGDAVIIGAGPDGELAFTRKEKGDGYLVSTNFNLSHHEHKEGLCSRYDTAVEMLEKIKDEDSLTVEYFREILDAVHAEGASSNTLYSNIFDLRNGTVYLYYWHQFDEVVVLSVEEELIKGTSTITSPTPIKDLFSQDTLEKAAREFEGYSKTTEDAGTGPLMVILGFFALMYLRRK